MNGLQSLRLHCTVLKYMNCPVLSISIDMNSIMRLILNTLVCRIRNPHKYPETASKHHGTSTFHTRLDMCIQDMYI